MGNRDLGRKGDREWITGTKRVHGYDPDFVIDLITMDHTVKELRQIASDLGVTRKRGDGKRETAAKIVYQAEDRLAIVDENPEYGTQKVVFDR